MFASFEVHVCMFDFVIQGEQKSPGVIPLAVKDVFGIIQEVVDAFLKWVAMFIYLIFFLLNLFILCQTPGREFLLRVSYLEIYNEVSLISNPLCEAYRWSAFIVVCVYLLGYRYTKHTP